MSEPMGYISALNQRQEGSPAGATTTAHSWANGRMIHSTQESHPISLLAVPESQAESMACWVGSQENKSTALALMWSMYSAFRQMN